ncbi:MAG TPA: LemA family protein [Fluviicola sp.]|nr:LemA family protein [Fluviicola sp.]
MLLIGGICLFVLLVLVVTFIVLYNRLVKSRNLVQSAYADIDVNLNKRFVLVPNLVAVTRNYAQYETSLLEKLVQQRTGSGTMKETSSLDEKMSNAFKKINIAVENYPDLKADHTFLKLMEDLGQIEDHLLYARRFYNGTTRVYNTTIQSFPAVIVAKLFGFKPLSFYEVSSELQREVPVI